jgi:Ion channel
VHADAPQHRRFGARVERLRASRSYGFVLGLVLVELCFLAVGPDARWAWSGFVLLQALILMIAVWTSGLAGVARRPALVVAGVAIAFSFGQYAWAESGRELVGIANVVMIIVTCAVIGVGIWDQGTVNAQSVLGVVTVYLLIGALFTFAFSAAAEIGSGPLFAQGTDGTIADRLYFSYVTLATLGYGDYTPAGTTARMMAVAEAILGQLYLVTIVALVVTRLRPKE